MARLAGAGSSAIGGFALLIAVAAAVAAVPSAAAEASLFDEAVRADDGRPGGAERAFALFRRAADEGVVQAQFNVAVMLDSGRGTPANTAQAATWYARAAAHGDKRAAYNLGQLYESGDGVPRNIELARAWYVASGLAAGRARTERFPPAPVQDPALTSPVPAYPLAADRLSSTADGVEIVWTEKEQSSTTAFYLEVREVRGDASREVYSGFARASSLFVAIPPSIARCAWRVYAIDGRARAYRASPWTTVDRW